ncbi:MAG: hypothetical protein ACOWWM_14825 [Desulfobacterales bacterium]
MGRQHSRQRQHLFIYLAGLFILVLLPGGCRHLKADPAQRQQAEQATASEPDALPAAAASRGVHSAMTPPLEALDEGERMLAVGNFTEAVLCAETVLICCRKDHGDRALYLMGLALAHPDNPGADPKAALPYFDSLVSEFPESGHVLSARVWAACLRRLIEIEHQVQGDAETIRKLRLESNDRKRRVQALQQQIEQLKAVDLDAEDNRQTPAAEP